jgi:hypothetical protein
MLNTIPPMPPVLCPPILTTGTLQHAFISLSAAVRDLTRFLLDDFPLRNILKQHGVVLLIITSGATATYLYRYFEQNRTSRAKIGLAVLHIVRTIENHPQYHGQLNDPEGLIHEIDAEVARMIDTHLTKDEAASAMTELKRKVWNDVDEHAPAAKRRNIDAATDEASVGEEDVAISEGAVDTVQTSAAIEAVAEGAVISRPTTPSIVAEEDVVTDEAAAVSVQSPFSMAAIQARSVSPLTEADIQAQLQCEMQELENIDIEDVDEVLPIISAVAGPVTVTPTISSSPEMPTSQQTPCPRPISPVRTGGYGLYYDDEALYSSSPDSSPPCSPEVSTPNSLTPFAIAEQKVKILQPAIFRHSIQSILLPFWGHLLMFESQTRPRHRRQSPRLAPGVAAVSLPSLRAYRHSLDPVPGTMHYRVNESRAFHNRLGNERKQRRRDKRKSIKKRGEKTARARQLSSDSHPSSETSRTSSPCSETSRASSICSEASRDSSPCLETLGMSSSDVVSVAEEVVTPAPSAKELRTPETPQTSGDLRRSARQNAFWGKYTR